jgi:hypothetical protein
MKSQYEKEYYDLLQTLRDKEDERAQGARKAEKAKLKRLRDLSRLLQTSLHCLEVGVPRSVIVSAWKNSAVLKPIGDFLFPDSK